MDDQGHKFCMSRVSYLPTGGDWKKAIATYYYCYCLLLLPIAIAIAIAYCLVVWLYLGQEQHTIAIGIFRFYDNLLVES